MLRLGLPEVWIDRVMTCMTTPTFSVRINGKAYGNITPFRGIWQGYPLSPYLFLLCAKGFSSLLAKVEGEGRIHSVSICRRTPSISHLLFVDDSLLFCRANQNEVLFLRFYRHMQHPRANVLILRNLLFILAVIQGVNKGRGLWQFWELKRLTSLNPILGYLFWWIDQNTKHLPI